MNFRSHGNLKETSGKASGFILVCVLHIILVFPFFRGHAHKVDREVKSEIELTIVAEQKREIEEPTPPAPLDLSDVPPIVIPELEAPKIETPHEETPVAIVEKQEQSGLILPAYRFVLPPNLVPIPIQYPYAADLRKCRPELPRGLQASAETVSVTILVVIGSDNQLRSTKVSKSSGIDELDKVAIDALKQCKFVAAIKNGAPVQSTFITQFEWAPETATK